MKKKCSVLGASGYVGAELLRLLADHPNFEVEFLGGDSAAGEAVRDIYPSLAASYPTQRFAAGVPEDLSDVIFLALPHGQSQQIVPEILGNGQGASKAVIVDLAADFRLRDPVEYEQWYGHAHSAPELLGQFSYGLPELFPLTRLVAAPGCYPTAAALALAPLLRAGIISEEAIIVDAASGVSGAGRSLQQHTSFSAADENFTAYGLCDHRHTPEIEQAVGAQVLFTPHLAPMNRGILATCYARPEEHGELAEGGGLTTEHLLDCYLEAYQGEPFIVVSEQLPATKAVQGSNAAHLSARYDPRTGYVIALCAIDNLGKGAAGQAVQCANQICEFPKSAGLSAAGMYP